MSTTPEEILRFWFGDAPAKTKEELGVKMRRWYQGGTELDREITERFREATDAAIAGELDAWADDPRRIVALIILLDQFPRSIYRNTSRAYAGDARAQKIAVRAFQTGLASTLPLEYRQFLAMPFVHAEDLPMQQLGCDAMSALYAEAPPELQPIVGMGVEQSRKYRDIIGRFGRFPHRNEIHGRKSTPDEIEFLKTWAQNAAPSGMNEPQKGG